ncbi:Gfo/Idh/MocA family protein [Pseudomaricurvus sp.]|uniref:Gfo/Idh/MocA family protein n=1 Tax=Pseudomaricurvus sp. TaxID=2004510 RepID=UPI003F6D329D
MICWGMIGAGDVTEVKSGPAFNKVENSTLIALMRRDADKARDYALRHGVPHWYTDVDPMLARSDINAIYIATPPSTHKEYALAALKAGKDVYLEKPMALDASESVEIVETAKQLGRKVCLAHYRRELPSFKKVKELIDSRAIGEVQFARIDIFQPEKSDLIAKTEDNWRKNPAISGGGLFHDIAPHQIDLMMHYFGSPLECFGLSNGKIPGVADVVSGQMLFACGTVFQGVWNFIAPESERRDTCTIIGDKGVIEFSFYQESVFLKTNSNSDFFEFTNPVNIQEPLIDRVVKYFSGRGENPCTGEDGVKIMEIMDTFTGSRDKL